ncbi:MAG: transporter, partial [Leptospira sp.]|nr:transporter [Leptospira sp.]
QGPYRYMSMPIAMKMEMTMVNLMKNINDKLAIMIMIPYVNNSMEMVSGNLEKSFMRTQGVGDIGATLIYRMFERNSHSVNIQFGLTLPTGSIDETNLMPLMGKVRSPYNMQPGSGTYNSIPGFSYIYKPGNLSIGTFGKAVLQNGKNDNAYRFGNKYEFSIWVSYLVLKWLSPTLRATGTKWNNISGSDATLDYRMDPQNDPNRQGGHRIDVLAGLNFMIPSLTENIKAGIEFGKPVHQHLNGPQLGANSLFNFRLQATF